MDSPINSSTFYYFNKYLPNILSLLLTNRKIDREEFWKLKDETIIKHFQKFREGEKIVTNLFNIFQMAEEKNEYYIYFLKQIDSMSKELFNSIGKNFNKKFRSMFEGKVFNFESLNYLSPIGELLLLNKFHFNSITKVLDLEHKLEDNKPTFDFLVECEGREYLLEVYNVHPNVNKENYLEATGAKIISKWKETYSEHDLRDRIFLLVPIIWFTQVELSGNNNCLRDFFNHFYQLHKQKIFTPLSIYAIKYSVGYTFKLDYLNNHLDELDKLLCEENKQD